MKKTIILLVFILMFSGCTNSKTNISSNLTNTLTNTSTNTPTNTSTNTPTNTPTNAITNNLNDYIKVYDSLIIEWKSALNNLKSGNDSGTDTLSFHFYDMNDSNNAKAYYALYDIDGNGTPELILRKTSNYEDIIAYIFTIKDNKTINIFGYDSVGNLSEVPWSRVGSSDILSNGLIDSINGDYTIYKIADDGCSVVEVASSEPYDYPDMANLADAKWRYYANSVQVNYDSYVQYLKEHGYTEGGDNALAIINWVSLD